MGAMDRRKFLAGAATTVALVGTTVALAEDDELGRLIEAHKVAWAEDSHRLGVFADREFGCTPEERQTLKTWIGDSGDAEYNAWYDLLEYRPRTMAEVRRRCDYMLTNTSWFESDNGDDAVEDFVRSMATLPAEVA